MCRMEYTNSQIKAIIADFVHSERDRGILLRRFVDGMMDEAPDERTRQEIARMIDKMDS